MKYLVMAQETYLIAKSVLKRVKSPSDAPPLDLYVHQPLLSDGLLTFAASLPPLSLHALVLFKIYSI